EVKRPAGAGLQGELPFELVQLAVRAWSRLGRFELDLDLLVPGDGELVADEDHLRRVAEVFDLDAVLAADAAAVGEEGLIDVAGHQLALDAEALVGAQGKPDL